MVDVSEDENVKQSENKNWQNVTLHNQEEVGFCHPLGIVDTVCRT